MVRRITRCCDSQQVGVPGLSTFSLRSAARGSWGVVFTCLLLAGRERELGDPDLAEDWIFFWGEISGVFFFILDLCLWAFFLPFLQRLFSMLLPIWWDFWSISCSSGDLLD